MLRAAKGIVIASTVTAAFAELYLAEVNAAVFWIAALGFVALLWFGEHLRRSALRLLMPAMYLAPAILLALRLNTDFSKDIVWLLPLLGLCLSGDVFRWWLPARWQWPLVTWATIVAIAWPIVFLREADFALWIMPLPRVSNTSIGISPWQVDLNVVYFALTHTAGILFIDALCRWFIDREAEFRRDVLVPLALASGVACAVAFYQGFVDLSFLNSNFWTYMIRASGTLADPNKLGAVIAFWTIGAVVLARRLEQPSSLLVTIGSIAVGVAAVWLCGSRTGLASVMISVVIAAFEVWRSSALELRKLAGAALLIVVGVVALAFVLNHASTHTVIQRGTWTYIPFYGDKTIGESVNELLWERYGYGPAAIEMIKEHPVEGVGPGLFHALSHDFGELAGHPVPQPDNAQAWWRHHLSELGAIGFIPLLVWCVVFGNDVFSRNASGDRLSIGMLRGVVIGFFIASLFGMPAQSMAIVITFWVFAFWIVLEKGSRSSDHVTGAGWSTAGTLAAVALIAVHATTTAVDAFGDLRPRSRAERFNWYYRYGYHINDSDGYDREPDPGGNPIMRRWTMKQSLAVIPVQGKVLQFVAWLDHPDADQKPVHVEVWADSKLVYEGDRGRAPLFLDIPATPGKTHMIIETRVDRTFRPSDGDPNSRDRRELGLSIRDWTWQ